MASRPPAKQTGAYRRLPPTQKQTDLYERVARLETMQEQQMVALGTLNTSVNEITQTLTKYQGFWGGVTIIATALMAFITLIKEPLFRKLGIES